MVTEGSRTRYVVTTPWGTFKRASVSLKLYTHIVVIEPPTDDEIVRYYRDHTSRLDVVGNPDHLEYALRYWRAPRSQYLGWTSRIDLARKLASKYHAFRVHIIDVVTDQEVV